MTGRLVAAGAEASEKRALADCVVLVTPRSFGEYDDSLRRELEESVAEVHYRPGPLAAGDLAEAVVRADGLLAGLDEITPEVFERASRLRVVARYGVGADRIDLEAAARHGVTVTATPGANANAVAELTIALLLGLARHVVWGRDRVRAGEWPAMRGVELAGRTIGLVGLGRIGSLVAAKARALGLRVLAHDPFVAAEQAEAAGCRLVDLETLAAESDFLSLHAQLTDQSRGIVDRALLARLKPGAMLVNTSRGELIDEDALSWALDHGTLEAAALDVLVEEPPPADHPLLRRDDVIVTPHMGAHTAEAATAMGRIALDELLAVLSGRPPRFPVVAAAQASSEPSAAAVPTAPRRFAFIGVTTGDSAIMRVFPAWAERLGLGEVAMAGHDLPIHAEPARYREVVAALRSDPLDVGGLVTTHKLDLFEACRDLFDEVDPYAELCREVSCLSKLDGRFRAHAKDPISSGRALGELVADGHFAETGADALLLGAGGANLAITLHLLTGRPPEDRPARIVVVDRSAERLASMRAVHERLDAGVRIEYLRNADAGVNDGLLAALPAGSLVVNGTGMGKDIPGSPISDVATFPEHGLVWELNYRGELDFLRQARHQAAGRGLTVEDGWRYFIHGWTAAIEEVFRLEITPTTLDELAASALPLRGM
jgi:phosphoglycerate dehydrogenase-like enzyme/shikimate 5-dehydrogenase